MVLEASFKFGRIMKQRNRWVNIYPNKLTNKIGLDILTGLCGHNSAGRVQASQA